MSTTKAPGAIKVLLAEESPHVVAEGLSLVTDFELEVSLELINILGDLRIGLAFLMLLIIDIVVQLFSHGIVKREFLVCSEDVSNKTQAKGEVGTKSLESVSNGLTSRLCSLCSAGLLEAHGKVRVLGVDILGNLDSS